jgi:hypothetical protein
LPEVAAVHYAAAGAKVHQETRHVAVTWDVLLLRVRPGIATAEDLAEDAVIPLGAPAQVRGAIQRSCPLAQFDDETTGRVQSAGYSMDLSLGDDDPVRGVLLLVSGEADSALAIITALCAANGWRAFDMNTEEFLDVA